MDMSDSDDWEPLKPAALHVLLALAEQDRHGYGILQAVRELSGGCVRLQTGSLYRHLSRLIDDGLVAESPSPRRVEDPRRGTHYHLTAAGRRTVERERRYLAHVLKTVASLRPALRRQA